MGLFSELFTFCEVDRRQTDCRNQPISTARNAFKVHSQDSVGSSTKVTLCMTQLSRAFTGEQIMGPFHLCRAKSCLLFVR